MWRWALVALPIATSAFARRCSIATWCAGAFRRWASSSAAGVKLHVEVTGSRTHPRDADPRRRRRAAGFPNKLREELARTHTVIAVDRPGHGYSTHGPRFLDADANLVALRAALKALGHDRATLVGHSYGAVLALRWALQAPAEVSAVVAIAPASAPYAAAARLGLLPVVTPVIGHVLAWTLLLPIGMLVARFTRSGATAAAALRPGIAHVPAGRHPVPRLRRERRRPPRRERAAAALRSGPRAAGDRGGRRRQGDAAGISTRYRCPRNDGAAHPNYT